MLAARYVEIKLNNEKSRWKEIECGVRVRGNQLKLSLSENPQKIAGIVTDKSECL